MIQPTAPVAANPDTDTFASPSTSTDTEPNVPKALGRTAIACALTPTPDMSPVADCPVTVKLDAPVILKDPTALVELTPSIPNNNSLEPKSEKGA